MDTGAVESEVIGRGWSFPLSINAHGGLALTSEKSEIDQAIGLVLSTSIGQRVMRPEFGCRLQELVFAPNNSQTAAQARRYVEEALTRWEPRIQLVRVEAVPDPDDQARMLIEIQYQVKSTRDRRSLVYPFYRIPEE